MSGLFTLMKKILLFPESSFPLTVALLAGLKNVKRKIDNNVIIPMSPRIGLRSFEKFLNDRAISNFSSFTSTQIIEARFMAFFQLDTLCRISNLVTLTKSNFKKSIDMKGKHNFHIHLLASKTSSYTIQFLLSEKLIPLIVSRYDQVNNFDLFFKLNRTIYNQILSSQLGCTSHSLRSLGCSLLVSNGFQTSFIMSRENWLTMSSFMAYCYDVNSC